MNTVAPLAKSEKQSNLDYALGYANRGWRVFPVHSISEGSCSCGRNCNHPGKHPRVSWKKSATTDHRKIHGYWSKYPDANVGITTGQSSNLIVLDIDPKNGGDKSLEQLTLDHPELAEHLATLSATTGGNGQHFYFQWREDQKTKHNAFSGGIDIQSDGAYVIAPPSSHVSGGIYYWDHDGNIEPYPDSLLYNGNRHAIRDMRWQGEIIEGTRNTTLASLAGTLFLKGLKGPQVLTKLSEENFMRCKPPLATEEVKQIVNSIKQSSGNDKKSFKTQWQESIVRSNIFNPQEVRTLMALSLYMDAEGRECFPSQELIAEDIHTTRQTVNKHIKKAETLSWINSYPRLVGNGKTWSKGYIATIPNT